MTAAPRNVGLDESTYYTFPTTSWPDSDPLVTGVGGTQLHLNASGQHTAPDSAWNDTYSKATQEYIFGDAGPNPLAGGGGKSIFFGRPGTRTAWPTPWAAAAGSRTSR